MSQLAKGKSTQRRVGPGLRPSLTVIGISVLLLLSTGFQPELNYAVAAIASGIMIALSMIGFISAYDFAARVVDLKLHALKVVLPIVLLIAGVVAFLWAIAATFPLGIPVVLGVPLFALGAVLLILNQARTRDSAERLELRRRLAAAREWFKRQLRSRDPQLDDKWLPYFLAFGLGSHVDRWFRAFGTSTLSTPTSFSTTSSSSSSVGSGWTGGGGTFGGAGASGSWASAAGSLAAGVSAPSSSGGSGGGSSGGSSGGGGGGGW